MTNHRPVNVDPILIFPVRQGQFIPEMEWHFGAPFYGHRLDDNNPELRSCLPFEANSLTRM